MRGRVRASARTLQPASSWALQAAEKLSLERFLRYWHLQGPKPNIDLIGFIGPTEVVPFYRTFKIPAVGSFSAACLATEGSASAFPRRLKPKFELISDVRDESRTLQSKFLNRF